jgi:hypothetical protein
MKIGGNRGGDEAELTGVEPFIPAVFVLSLEEAQRGTAYPFRLF